MGEIIFVILIIVSILITLCLYKLFDKRGLYFSLTIHNILTIVLLFKIAYIYNMNINIGIIPMISSFSIIYFIIIKYGEKNSKELIKLSFIENIITSILLVIMNFYIPAVTETISINMKATFVLNYKIFLFWPLMMLISQNIIIKLYKMISNLQENNIINIILTYIITGVFYVVIFYLLAYLNVLDLKSSLFVGVSTYIMGMIITIINIIPINYITMKRVK